MERNPKEADVKFSWDHPTIGNGFFILHCWTTGGPTVYAIDGERPVDNFFEIRSGQPPKGLLLPTKGTILGIEKGTWSSNVYLTSDNHAAPTILANSWYFADDGRIADGVMFERYVPITGGPVPGYPIKYQRLT